MVRFGIIGCGVMGREHYRNIAVLGHGHCVTAVCDDHEPSIKAILADGSGGLEEGRRPKVVRNIEEELHVWPVHVHC